MFPGVRTPEHIRLAEIQLGRAPSRQQQHGFHHAAALGHAVHLARHHIQSGLKGRARQQGGRCQGTLAAYAGEINPHPFLLVVCFHSITTQRFLALKAVGAICRQIMQPEHRVSSTARLSPWR